MLERPGRSSLAGLAGSAVVLVACTAAGSPTPGPTDPARSAPPASAAHAASAAPSVLPPGVDHRIGVRVLEGAGELFDRVSGERFVARGTNLIRLAGGSHATLDPARYDPDRLEDALAEMAGRGYNVVRVFLNSRPGGMPGDNAAGLSDAYLDNVVDLLRRARAHGVFVLLTLDWLPENAAWAFDGAPLIDNVNAMYLAPEGVTANERFFAELARALVRRQAPLDALLAYELRNELYFTDAYPPFSLTEGLVTTANGRSYDLASDEDRRSLLEENLVAWVDRMRSAILAVDPTALVTIGFFQPQGPNPSRQGDDRLIETRDVIRASTVDFVDLHGYPGGELNLAQLVENYDLPTLTAKPILLGEFGAEHGPYPTVDDAVRALVEWQVESCVYGFDGWLSWTWDSAEQPEFWNAMDAGASIADALSPGVRPDPCTTDGVELAIELARLASVTASSPGVEGPPSVAVDGLPATSWSAGNDAPQWIELDLGAAATVESVRLLVAQYPNGPTTHVVSLLDGARAAIATQTLAGTTSDSDWLQVEIGSPLEGVRYVRVETTASPSWVAWREISVLGERP